MGKRASQSGQLARENGSADSELEFIINELAADQAAVRIVLQCCLLRLFAARPEIAPAAFAELEEHVFSSIRAIPLAPEDEIGGARWKKLVHASAENLLGEITDTLDASVGGRPSPRPPNATRRYPSSSG